MSKTKLLLSLPGGTRCSFYQYVFVPSFFFICFFFCPHYLFTIYVSLGFLFSLITFLSMKSLSNIFHLTSLFHSFLSSSVLFVNLFNTLPNSVFILILNKFCDSVKLFWTELTFIHIKKNPLRIILSPQNCHSEKKRKKILNFQLPKSLYFVLLKYVSNLTCSSKWQIFS